MINIVFYMFIMAFSVNLFSITIQYSHVNRTFYGITKGIMEMSIVTLSEEENFYPYYDEKMLKDSVINYFITNLDGSVESFDVGFYFFNKENKGACLNHVCNGVRISLSTKIISLIAYYRALNFEIKENQYE